MIRKMLANAVLAALLMVAALSVFCSSVKAQQAAPPDDGTGKALTAIAGAGTMRPRAFEYLTELSDDIGARVTGSPAAAQAVDWGVLKMKAIGLENVHAEPWKLSHSWTRILEDAELVAPIHQIGRA